MKYFDPHEKVEITRHKLPHWKQVGCACGMTFRLADSLPQQLLDPWLHQKAAWMELHPRPWTEKDEADYHQRFTGKVQDWLDQGHGSCVLRDAAVAAQVAQKFHERDGADYTLWAFVIMPNHAHVLFSFSDGETIPMIAQRWKGGSAREINKLLGRSGRLWQPDYFDRLVRSSLHFQMGLDYIRDNPAKAKLREGEYLWWERADARSADPAPAGPHHLKLTLKCH